MFLGDNLWTTSMDWMPQYKHLEALKNMFPDRLIVAYNYLYTSVYVCVKYVQSYEIIVFLVAFCVYFFVYFFFIIHFYMVFLLCFFNFLGLYDGQVQKIK